MVMEKPDKASCIRLDWAGEGRVESSRDNFRSKGPFPHLVVQDLVADDAFLDLIQDELMEVEFFEKDNDLFRFHQSNDLANCESRSIKTLIHDLYSAEFRTALEEVSGIKLNDQIDVTSSLYCNTNTLLAHDDQLLGRAIAFILYLVPEDWTDKDGGALCLFDTEDGEPVEVATRITPRRNSFAFFEVSHLSFHQVEEVLNKSKHRLSINGWFHADKPRKPVPKTPIAGPSRRYNDLIIKSPCLTRDQSATIDQRDLTILSSWINPMYLREKTLQDICDQFENDSMLELKSFLLPSRWAEVQAALDKANWTTVGPYNKRHFDALSPDSDPNCSLVRELHTMLQGTAFGKLMFAMTGGLLITGTESIVRKFTKGTYTLAFDADPIAEQPALDICLCLAGDEWSTALSDEDADIEDGAVFYVDEEATEPLITIAAQPNSLSLVYRAEPGTMRFVKFVSNEAPGTRFDVDLICSVMEPNDDNEPAE